MTGPHTYADHDLPDADQEFTCPVCGCEHDGETEYDCPDCKAEAEAEGRMDRDDIASDHPDY